MAVQSGIDWLSISPSPPAVGGAGGISVITMSIEIEGGFFQVLDYLNRLEELERLVVVDAITISGATIAGGDGDEGGEQTSSATGAPTLSVTLNARMFTRADAAFGATGDGGDTTATTAPSQTPDVTVPDTSNGNQPV